MTDIRLACLRMDGRTLLEPRSLLSWEFLGSCLSTTPSITFTTRTRATSWQQGVHLCSFLRWCIGENRESLLVLSGSFLRLTWQGPTMCENDHLTNQNGRRSQYFGLNSIGISIWIQNTWIRINATIVMINFRWTIAVPIFVQGLAVCLAPYLLLLENGMFNFNTSSAT